MKIVRTTQAKTKIRQWFKKELKAENIELGHTMLEREATRNAVQLSQLTKAEYLEPVLRKYAFLDLEDIYSSVGFGALSAASVIARLLEEQRRHERPAPHPPPPRRRRGKTRSGDSLPATACSSPGRACWCASRGAATQM